MKIKLVTIEEIKKLTHIASCYESDIFLKHGHYVVDCTSLLGIISLNLDSPVEIEMVEKKPKEFESFICELRNHGFELID